MFSCNRLNGRSVLESAPEPSCSIPRPDPWWFLGKRCSILFLLFASCHAGILRGEVSVAVEGASDLRLERLPDGTRYALIGNPPVRPAPTLFLFQGDIDEARRQRIYTEVARIVAQSGFVGVVLDAPAHGEDRRPGEPKELAAWCWRIEHGENLVAEFISRARAVLDHLIREKSTDPSRIAAVGTSRGGFLAFHFAAAEPRVRCVGGISPVTDLFVLRKFHVTTEREASDAFSLSTLAPRLAKRPAWISIGNQDTRVGTENAIAFSRALVAAAGSDSERIPVDLMVHATPGHRSTEQDHVRLAAWLLDQLSVRP